MRNQSNFQNKNQRHWCRFWVFIDNFETPSAIIFLVNFKPAFVYWANSECYFSIKKLCPNFYQSEQEINPYQSRRFLKNLLPKYFRKPEAYFQPSRISAIELFLQE